MSNQIYANETEPFPLPKLKVIGESDFTDTGITLTDGSVMSEYQLTSGILIFNTTYFAVEQDPFYRIVKIGGSASGIIQFSLNAVVSTLAAGATPELVSSTLLPAEFRPSLPISFPISITDNGATLGTAGLLQISNTGEVKICRNLNCTTNFTPSANGGWPFQIQVSYLSA